MVVNCFQKLLSSWHETTNDFEVSDIRLLWIAFKNYYLRDTKQPGLVRVRAYCCCELLSKIIIFVTRNNWTVAWPRSTDVVNCFQKLLSSWHETTMVIIIMSVLWLWIAFKNYYLRDTKQLLQHQHKHTVRCELLSKIIIFVTRNNYNHTIITIITVVNCFQKLLSSWHETTINHTIP